MPDTVTYNQTEIPKEDFVAGLLDHLNLTDEEKGNSDYLKSKTDATTIEKPAAVDVRNAPGDGKTVGQGNPQPKVPAGESGGVKKGQSPSPEKEVGPVGGTLSGGIDYQKGKIVTSDPSKIQITTHYKPIKNSEGDVFSPDGQRKIGHFEPGHFSPNIKGNLTPEDMAFLHGMSVLPNSNPTFNSWNDDTYAKGNIKVDLWLEDQSGVHPYVNTIEQTKSQ